MLLWQNIKNELVTTMKLLMSEYKPTQLVPQEVVAEMLGLKPATLSQWRWIGDKRLPWVKLGKAVRYKLSDVEDYIDKCTVY